MKRILSIILTLVLMLTLGSVAMADGDSTNPTPATNASTATTFMFDKVYKTTSGKTPATYPAEVLKFSVTPDEGNPDTTMITIADATVAGNPYQITVTVPAYTKVGKYNYTISELAGDTQGVIYSSNSFDVQVMVSYGGDGGLVAQTSFTTSGGSGESGKIEEIVNTYDLGTLTVDKVVTGNLGSKTQQFDIDVTFTSKKPVKSTISGAATIEPSDWDWSESEGVYTYTTTVSLADGDSVATFSNIPAGVEYKVVEDSKHTVADTNGSDPAKGYNASYSNEDDTIEADATSAAVVTNTKGAQIDTGITTDNMPYIVLLGVVMLAGAAMLLKRRSYNN